MNKSLLVIFSIIVSGCSSISMISNGISSNGKYVFTNSNKAGENRLLVQFDGKNLLAKNMKDASDTAISPGEVGVYSANYYNISSGRLSFRIKSLEPCPIALTGNKHPFFIAAHDDRENKTQCSIRYMADIKTAQKI